jgi:PAS domain S-box-containing protein
MTVHERSTTEKGPYILVLEDDDADAELIEWELRRAQLDSVRTMAEEDFRSALKSSPPDLILSDFQLPGFDGFEALTLARQHIPDVPFIFVSGVLGEELAVEALKRGATDYVLKGRLRRLLPAVQRALQESLDRRRRAEAEKTAREVESRFMILTQTIPGVVFIHQDGRFRYVNPATEAILGYSAAELLQMHFWEVIHPSFRDFVRERGLKRQEGDVIQNRYEFKIIQKSGAERWLDCTATRIELDGKPAVLGSAIDITERKQTEEALRASEERFRQLVENIREVFWLSNVEKTEIVYVSPGYESIWGRSCAGLYASPQDWLEAIHPDDRERVREAAVKKQISGQYREVFRILRPDGSIRWIADRAVPIRDASGQIYRVAGIAEDVTERKRVERHREAFSTLAQQLSAATTPSEAARIIVGVADALLGWDACYLHLYSAQREIVPVLTMDTFDGRKIEVHGSTFSLDPSPLMLEVTEKGAKLINRGAPEPSLPRLTPFGDQGRPSASMIYVPIRTSGKVIGILSIQSYIFRAYDEESLSTLQALADHCGGALERIQIGMSLRESEERYRSLVEFAPIGIALHDVYGMILHANRRLQEITGYSEEELRLLGVNGITHADDVATGQQFSAELGGGERNFYQRQSRLVRKDGQIVWAESTASAVRDAGAQLRYIISMVEDINQRKQLEREILEISGRERRTIGHDLHDGLSPLLNGIACKAKALEQDLGPGSAAGRAVREIALLLNDASIQARSLAHGLVPFELETHGFVFAMNRLASETKKLFGIGCRFESDVAQVNLEPIVELHLYRITQEAINNAIKHGKARQVVVKFSLQSGQLCLTIRDDGIGLAMATHANGSDRGMGLQIMRYRAKSIGGGLEVCACADRGTEIVCRVHNATFQHHPR